MKKDLYQALCKVIEDDNIPVAIKLKKVGYIVRLGCDLNTPSEVDGTVPLMNVKDVEVAEELIRLGADVNYVNPKSGKNVLFYAKSFELAKLFVDKGIEIYSCFDDAVRYDKRELVSWLIDLGADINKKTKDGMPYIHIMASRVNVEMFKEVFPFITDINVRNSCGQTCLMKLLPNLPFERERCVELAKFLMDKGIDVNALDKDGQSVLFYLDNNIELLEKTIEKGVDINLCDNNGDNILNYTLCHGSFWGRKEFVECLLKNGADIDKKNHQGISPILNAICKDDLYEAALEMILREANVDVKTENGDTPLMLALKDCNKYDKKEREDNVILALIEKSNDINVVNNEGISAFSICLRRGLYRFMEPLISKGAIVSHEDMKYASYSEMVNIREIQKKCMLKKMAKKNIGKKKRNYIEKVMLNIRGEFGYK